MSLRRMRATRHELRYGLMRANDEEEFALLPAFVRIVGEHGLRSLPGSNFM